MAILTIDVVPARKYLPSSGLTGSVPGTTVFDQLSEYQKEALYTSKDAAQEKVLDETGGEAPGADADADSAVVSALNIMEDPLVRKGLALLLGAVVGGLVVRWVRG